MALARPDPKRDCASSNERAATPWQRRKHTRNAPKQQLLTRTIGEAAIARASSRGQVNPAITNHDDTFLRSPIYGLGSGYAGERARRPSDADCEMRTIGTHWSGARYVPFDNRASLWRMIVIRDGVCGSVHVDSGDAHMREVVRVRFAFRITANQPVRIGIAAADELR